MGFSASREVVVVQVEERSSPGTIIIIALHCIIRLEAGAAQVAFFQRDRCRGRRQSSTDPPSLGSRAMERGQKMAVQCATWVECRMQTELS